MSNSQRADAGKPYDPSLFYSLYGDLQSSYAPQLLSSSVDTLDMAASQAASLGLNQWYAAMAQQLAAHDYLTRLQGSESSSVYSNILSSTLLPKLPDKYPLETNVIKYTSSSSGPKIPGTSNRGRKKTISLDSNTQCIFPKSQMTSSSYGVPLKTKTNNNDSHKYVSSEETEALKKEGPLNLSLKSSDMTPSNQIPSEYYASQALSGAFLAEQIRQSTLAAALETRLGSSGSFYSSLSDTPSSLNISQNIQSLQTALLFNKIKDRGDVSAPYNKSLKSSNVRQKRTSAPKKNTVASLLAKNRNDVSFLSNSELTIEPIIKISQSSSKFESLSHLTEHAIDSEVPLTDFIEKERKKGMKGSSQRHYSLSESSEFRIPLLHHWRRETVIREMTVHVFIGNVTYISPSGVKFHHGSELPEDVKSQFRFTFHSLVILGDYVQQNEDGKTLIWNERQILEVLLLLHKKDQEKNDDDESNKNAKYNKVLNSQKDSSIKKRKMKGQPHGSSSVLRSNETLHSGKGKKLIDQSRIVISDKELERRRQHLIWIQELEARKSLKDKERKKESQKKERERRNEEKRLEYEISRELTRPLEDMSIPNAKPLPELPRIEGLALCGQAFANTLMIFEFLHTFGETLGFDMESLPKLSSLQSALLNEPESEEELLSILLHLVVCAIEDPGIPNPQKHLTLLGQNLRQADITNTNISEVLHIYLAARGQVEVKLIHGLSPPEGSSKNGKKEQLMEEYQNRLKDTKPFKMSNLIKNKPFLSLNPTEKSDIIAFLCNELLGNKAVIAKVEANLENISKAKKNKWAAENKLKKLKILQMRKLRNIRGAHKESSELSSELCETLVSEMEDGVSVTSRESYNETPSSPIKSQSRSSISSHKKIFKVSESSETLQRQREDEESEEMEEVEEEYLESSDIKNENENDEKSDREENENTMSSEDIVKKIEKMNRILDKRRNELIRSLNSFRANDLGQDRYRRRYWNLAHVNGIFVESMESSEPWKLSSQGLSTEWKKNEGREEERERVEEKEERLGEGEEKNSIGRTREEEKSRPETKDEEKPFKRFKSEDESESPQVTPNGESFNLLNHSAKFNKSLSPLLLNGSVTITPKTSLFTVPSTTTTTTTNNKNEKAPWFSLHSSNNQHSEDCTSESTVDILEKRLESVKRSDDSILRRPIPQKYSYNWWQIVEENDLTSLKSTLHSRGFRESSLLHNLKKSFDFLSETQTRNLGKALQLSSLNSVSYENIHFLFEKIPAPDTPGSWSKSVALRVDKYILEQVEALEDKVAGASMQVPGWKIPTRPDIDERAFSSSCKENESERNEEVNGGIDAVSEAKERLLDLELHIERRYLKAPLGVSNHEPTLESITSSRKQDGRDEDVIQGGIESIVSLPRGLLIWRDAVRKSVTAAQVAMAFYVLETSIAWSKSIMKAFCQLCHSGDNEDSLLLCDGCDKGYHMYCFKPVLSNVPEGDWYCFECINKATGVKHCLICGQVEGKTLGICYSCPRAYHFDCLTPSLSKSLHNIEEKGYYKVPKGKWQCPNCGTKKHQLISFKKKAARQSKSDLNVVNDVKDKESSNESLDQNVDLSSSFKKKRKMFENDLSICSTLVFELENLEEAWPFLYPVNTKQFPTYKKIIKAPMDIATIKRKLESGTYTVREEFCNDVRQIFANCEIFNEDDSPVGKAGHAMRTFFETRWSELIFD